MDTTMDKCKHCSTNGNNVYICPLVQQANKVVWVELSYHPTKHGGGGLKAPDEADRRQTIRKAERKQQLEKRLEKVAVKGSGRATKPESVRGNDLPAWQKFRADPSEREHENALRRAKKRQQTSNGPSPSSKRRRLNNESSASMYYDDLLSYPQPLWDKAKNDFFKSISDGPVHRCICCDRLWFHQSMTLQSKSKLQTKNVKFPVSEQIFPPNTDEGEFCSTCMSYIRGSKVPPLAPLK
ncbi:ATP-dependent DNA helicase [Caerostris darwini]|uniref:ATP-dependent DNA helicase n=1 Tax=Caerostris darwini TaxID=1538125 RepID=A0AAV4UTM6_9ARAC|nr:ATP-dependent DNA helicase [Caerostris darwini]